MYRRPPAFLAAAFAAIFSPIAAAAAMLPASLPNRPLNEGRDWGEDPPRRGSRINGPPKYRPAAPWVPNTRSSDGTGGLHWEKGALVGPAGKGAHRKHDFKAAQRAKRKARSAKRADAYLRSSWPLTPCFLRR